MFEREDWKLFRNIETLCQKAGVSRSNIAKLVVKELVDNGLDASDKCDLGLIPNENGFYVRDYGSGMDESLISDLFSIGRNMITSKLLRLPTRGALGNGLRVVTGAVVSTGGKLFVSSHNKKYEVISLEDGSTEVQYIGYSDIYIGTRVDIILGSSLSVTEYTLKWGKEAILLNQGERCTAKTSPMWYTSESFFELVNAYNSKIIDLLLMFEGVTEKKLEKAFYDKIDLYREADTFTFDETEQIMKILRSDDMFKHVKHAKLGYVGDFYNGGMGAYSKKTGDFWIDSSKGEFGAKIPFTVECWVRIQKDYVPSITVNKTPITGEFSYWYDKGTMKLFRCGLNIDVKLKPSQLVVNIITPYMPITSDGKSPDFTEMNHLIQQCLNSAKSKAKKIYMAENDINAKNEKEIIINHMDEAIEKASGGGLYKFSQRQLYYAIRPYVMNAIEKQPDYNYFCRLLTEYENEYGDVKGLYRDPRGTLYHPHLNQEIPLGTIAVNNYERPKWTFNKILYCEKEGFFPILRDAKFPERFDCALLSSKGYASRAVKDLFDLLGETDEEILFFCIHDSDSAGTMIYETLQEETLSRAGRKVKVINLGLDPWEAINMGLEIETFETKSKRPVARYVKDYNYNNDDYEEIDYVEWLQTNRIELNAMTTPQFLKWIERKMSVYDNGKVIPDSKTIIEKLHEDTKSIMYNKVMQQILRESDFEQRLQYELKKAVPLIVEKVYAIRENIEDKLEEVSENHWTKPVNDIANDIADKIVG